jgi:transcription termination/antitermination protein NusA
VLVDDEAKQATVIVPDDQLSLAIGKDGLNARLAARLTGWRVDIRSETEFAEEESEMGYAEEDVAGRCAAILANGKRCPNASLPGSRYCGLPAHQALDGTGTDYLVPPEEGEEPAGDGDEAAAGDGELAAVEAAAVEEAPVEEAAVEDLIEGSPGDQGAPEEALVEDAAAADQPLDEEPVDEAEPVAEDEPADAEGEVAVAEDEPLAEDESAPAEEPLAEQEDPVEEEAAIAADEDSAAQEAEES